MNIRLFGWAGDGKVVVVDAEKGTCLLDQDQIAEEIVFSPANKSVFPFSPSPPSPPPPPPFSSWRSSQFPSTPSFLAVWHKGHFAQKDSSQGAILTKDIRLEEGANLQVHRITFKSEEEQRREEELKEKLRSNASRENLVIYNLKTGVEEARFFQREVRKKKKEKKMTNSNEK